MKTAVDNSRQQSRAETNKTQFDSLGKKNPIVFIKSDGLCGGSYATVTIGNHIVLPTKAILRSLRIDMPIPPHAESKIIMLPFVWGKQRIFVASIGGPRVSVKDVVWKSFTGEHEGLDPESTCWMRALHSSFYCQDGFLGQRQGPPTNDDPACRR